MSTGCSNSIIAAEWVLPAGDLSATLSFFTDELGFRLDSIAPADAPSCAQLSGHGLNLRLDTAFQGASGTLRLGMHDDTTREALTAPNGTRIEFGPALQPLILPELKPSPGIQRFSDRVDAWKAGRAGMQYRDLIPDRLGGYLIASHIRIPEGGPVADNVHYHDVHFQLIYGYRGWVRLVYEDQGEPFVMRAGDCVLQPPHIRHRVLESSDGFEAIEVGSPARHVTYLDHEMALPTGRRLPERDYNGQSFLFHEAKNARWDTRSDSVFAIRNLGLDTATGDLVNARVLRHSTSGKSDPTKASNPECTFNFVLQGELTLTASTHADTTLEAGDSFVIPGALQHGYKHCSDNLELLEIVCSG